MKQFFTSCTSLDELKKAYRKAAMENHPDRGGDVEVMKSINAEHDALFEILKSKQNRNADEDHQTTETAEEFREIIVVLLRLYGLEIELCGSWLWIGGNTREHKEALKSAGCRWSNNKQLWYWHHVEAGSHWHRGKRTMGEIRTKYGSETIRSGGHGSRLGEATA